jgi:CHAT domain-containing protein
MVFAQNRDTLENGLLNTYEIYNLDLDDAKMVVLSSCNTGAGYLQSGEGVISLARGFMYAGSSSVVMSLWEVDDYSGSEIIKSFYSNLKWGYSKSEALKRSREDYLRSADQLRSHPYFWCSMVILGEDEPLYFNRLRLGLVLLLLFSVIFVWRRYYRPKSS